MRDEGQVCRHGVTSELGWDKRHSTSYYTAFPSSGPESGGLCLVGFRATEGRKLDVGAGIERGPETLLLKKLVAKAPRR
jgi:hypothetical protein